MRNFKYQAGLKKRGYAKRANIGDQGTIINHGDDQVGSPINHVNLQGGGGFKV